MTLVEQRSHKRGSAPSHRSLSRERHHLRTPSRLATSILCKVKSIHKIAAVLVWTEAVFLVLIALYLLIRGLTSELSEGDALFAEVIFALVGAVGLFFAGRGFMAQRYFGRGATVLANLIALGVAYYMIDGGRIWWGISLGAVAMVTVFAALAAIPKSRGVR